VVCISFIPPFSGAFEICATFGHEMSTNNSDAIQVTWQLIETPLQATTITQEGKERIFVKTRSANGTTAIDSAHGVRMCGIFQFDSVQKRVIRLMYEQDLSNSPVVNNQLVLDRSATLGQRDMHFTVKPLVQNIPAAVFNNAVTAPSGVGQKMVSAYIEDAGVVSQSGNWISSKVNDSSGKDTINITGGTFSSAPACTISTVNPSVARSCHIDAIPTASVIKTICCDTDAGTVTDLRYSIICMGDR
ncbi:MAG: hypothetical protein IID18_00245, partial [Nitrospinae bacterium]|nr:hypothetical protein [Nitrospinota bacterium]